MAQSLRYTSADLELMPDDGKRYEIIDGELYVSKQAGYEHQLVSGRIFRVVDPWNVRMGLGEVVFAPGVVFADDDDVIPDLVWISHERLRRVLGAGRHFHGAPELVIEVLSPGSANERRDREAKLKLYSRRGVLEYWIVDWQRRQVEVYRREDLALRLYATLTEVDTMTSPVLPGFGCQVAELFAGLPTE